MNVSEVAIGGEPGATNPGKHPQGAAEGITSRSPAREKIRLVSSAGTGHFYTTDKNKKTMTGKMEIKKFDPRIRKHVMYKEAKIK